ncbi:MAG: hypothetical protein GC155_01900 [Alphaproteobacteria bacterium]|nr:hypothetical protein [Alphaproteobacteria bacterium]
MMPVNTTRSERPADRRHACQLRNPLRHIRYFVFAFVFFRVISYAFSYVTNEVSIMTQTSGQTVKATVSVGSATLDIEGDQQTVTLQIERFYELFGKNASQIEDHDAGEHDKKRTATRSSGERSRKASGGPSCRSRIEAMLTDNFFSKPRSTKEIADGLNERATPYPANHIAAAVQQLTKRGTLRRMKEAGGWVYLRP